MTREQRLKRQIIIRIPDDWTAAQLEWALDFLGQVERRIWSIFEEHHLASVLEDDTYKTEDPQLALPLGDRGFTDEEIPF